MNKWFNNLSMKSKFLAANSVAIVLVVILAVIIYLNVNRFIDTTNWVMHTEKVIDHGHILMEELINMETGERGFIITGNPEFLEPYKKSLSTFNDELKEAKDLVSDNPKQVKRLDEVGILANKWVENIAKPLINARKSVAAGAKSFEDLQNVLNMGEGKKSLITLEKSWAFLIIRLIKPITTKRLLPSCLLPRTLLTRKPDKGDI